jgi:predicted nucleotidyltransferase
VISPDGHNVPGSNPWLRRAADNFSLYDVGEGVKVKAVRPPYFLATKLTAFADRAEDVLSSKDAEDIVALVVTR